MSHYREVLAANTSAYAGYSLEVALEEIASLGYRRVEIASMVGLVEHVAARDLTSRGAQKVKGMLAERGLSTLAFSGHSFLHEPHAVEVFLPRMEFAREIGARIINTKAGSPQGLGVFLSNMEKLLPYAEEYDIIIGLETHGDIVDHGLAAVAAVKQFASPRVVLNYDFGNVLINSGGKIDPVSDFAAILDEVGHLHLKDAVLCRDWWRWTSIGQGAIDYRRLFEILAAEERVWPMTVDLPLGLALSIDAKVRTLEQPFSCQEINQVMRESLEFVSGS